MGNRPAHVTDSPPPPGDARIARPLLTPVAQTLCGASVVYSRAEHVFSPEHDFASMSIAGVREALKLYVSTPIRKYRIRQLCTGWWKNFWWMLVFENMLDICCEVVL
jgi:hypothetical protein